MPLLKFKFTSAPERKLRAMRQTAGTVYHQLLAQGFTHEEIMAEEDSSPGTRRIGLSLAQQDGSDVPVVGVSYGGDFRSEEERGIPEIARALKDGGHKDRLFTGEAGDVWYLGLHADRGLSTWQPEERLRECVETALRRSREEARDEHWRDRWLKVAELRDLIRAAGVDGPLPRTKAALQDIVATKVRKQHLLSNVGEFHHGDTLILIPARPVITATLRILAESGKHLRMGGSSSPFGRGASLYDERDLTGVTIESARAHADYAHRLNRKAEPTRKALRKKGMLFFLGNPTRRDGRDIFWLNYSPNGHKQVFGWFTLTELNDKLASDDWSQAA